MSRDATFGKQKQCEPTAALSHRLFSIKPFPIVILLLYLLDLLIMCDAVSVDHFAAFPASIGSERNRGGKGHSAALCSIALLWCYIFSSWI
jgi:hypothetical protein